MKKQLFVLTLVLLGLFAGVNTVLADATIYFASLKAQSDPGSTGSGQVKLTWLDIKGKPMAITLAKQINYMAFGDASFMSKDYVYDGFGDEAQLAAGTMCAIDGMEQATSVGGDQLYMTSYVYFHAEAEPADGSYLSSWTFTDPQITRMTGEMTPADPMGEIKYTSVYDVELGQWVDVVDEENSIPLRSPCFKVLPVKENSALYNPGGDVQDVRSMAQHVANNPNKLYAVFAKYLLSNPVATSASLEAAPNATADLTVTLEITGDTATLDIADFADFSFTNNDDDEWTYDLATALADTEVVSAQLTRITIPVTYTYKNTGYGLKNTTMTISMAGDDPSTLNVNLSVNALNPSRPEAYWFDGNTEKTSGTLAAMLAVDISGYAKPVLKLNKTVATNLTFSDKDFTLDLNGNTVQAITVSSGNVTFAFSSFGGSATSLTVNGGKAILNGGTFGSLTVGASGTVEQNGATISGAATNAGSLTTIQGTFNGGLTTSNTLVMNGGTFKGETAVTVSGGTAAINRATIDGTAIGLKVTGGTATTKKLAAIKGATYSAQRTGGTLTVESGKFDGPLNGTVDFTAGFFKTNTYGISTAGKIEMNVSAGVEYNEGYRYFLGTAESAIVNGVGVCRIGTTSYSKLEDAIAYANNNPGVSNIVIFMTNNYTLPAGYYTLPANATIVVPMSDSQAKEVNATAPRVVFNDQNTSTPYVDIMPTEFRRLTFASGVKMEVFGDIEMTCSQYASNEAYTSQPCGAYGHLVLEEGSCLTLQSGSEVRAWGFVTGKGEMDARRGSKVREMFQLGDWKGAMTSVAITGLVKESENPTLCDKVKDFGHVDDCDYSEKKIFPVTQYFIQNIESPVKYHPGAVLSTSAAVSEGLLGMSVSMAATDVAIVGVSGQHQAIFLMDQKADAENTWVRKWYDSEHDIQVYDINSAAHIGSMLLDMGEINLLSFGSVPIRLNSAKFDLPLTCNFKIHLLSGTMDFQQNTCLLPGAEVEVDKESTVTVAMDSEEKAAYDAWVDGGRVGDAPVSYTGALYVYDADEWDKYAYCNEYDGSTLQKSTAYTKTVRFAPSWVGKGSTPGKPDVRNEQVKPADASINVHGTFMTAEGFVYCSEHGANIFSSNEDAGTFIFNEDAEDAGTRTVYNVKGVQTYETRTFYPAKLKNGVADPQFANTSTAVAGDAYCYTEDKWNIFEAEGCFMKDDYETYYAKPQEYVALANGMTENSDHTYSDANGSGRLFILISRGGCQWWEVEKKDNLYHCIHPENDTYYYWDDTYEEWKEVRFTITWKNYNGDIIQTADQDGNPQDSYEVPYGTQAEFLGNNPTRPQDIDYTYDFTGWSPTPGKVTSNVTYVATYTSKPRKYTIIFQNEGGTEIERHFLTHNQFPVCENVPTKVGYTLQWSPALAAVIGDATYTATWLENPPTEYTIRFVDYDGTELTSEDVPVGTLPAAPAIIDGIPTGGGKPASPSGEFTYVFDHWSPAIEEVTQAMTYTAIYREVQREYTVTFLGENGTPTIETKKYHIGETPVCSTPPTKANTAQYSYALRWTPQIQTVLEDATYTAVFDATTNKYTVSAKCSPAGAAVITGNGIYDYNAAADAVSITITPNPGYDFQGWQDLSDKTITNRTVAVTGDVDLLAVFTVADPDYTITWKNYDGTTLQSTGQKSGTATTYTGATPTKPSIESATYTFDGWSTTQGGDLAYKNGMTPKATADATYYAHFAETPIQTLEVSSGEPVVLSYPVTYQNLILSSDGITSGELVGANFLTLTGKAYFDLALNAQARLWYQVAVPWQVDARTGISVNGNTLVLGRDFDIIYYDGEERATNHVSKAWSYVEDGDKMMYPGQLYMITLMADASVVRFEKADDVSSILTTHTQVYKYDSDVSGDRGWNGVSNPALFHAYVNAGVPIGQVYVPAEDNYTTITLNDHKLVVGQGVYVQVDANKDITVTYGGSFGALAPIRRSDFNETSNYEVRIAPINNVYTDRVFVQTDDSKAPDTYTIGKDLAKMGVSSKVAQMWIDRYDAKLCLNTMAPVDGEADYPLTLSVPQDGKYTIDILRTTDKQPNELYLTLDGKVIWNLSQNAYSITLEQGSTSRYGLRTISKAPEVITDIDNIQLDEKSDAKVSKRLINSHIYIIRDGKTYTIEGQIVK